MRMYPRSGRWRRHLMIAMLMSAAAITAPTYAGGRGMAAAEPASAARPARLQRPDHPGHRRVGMASYYSHRLSGRRMADGTPMRPESDSAASRTLPLGTRARVINLDNGRSATVTIRDRGPYVRGRIIDVSRSTARQLGMIHAGVVRVEVTPLRSPHADRSANTVVAGADPDA